MTDEMEPDRRQEEMKLPQTGRRRERQNREDGL